MEKWAEKENMLANFVIKTKGQAYNIFATIFGWIMSLVLAHYMSAASISQDKLSLILGQSADSVHRW